MENFVAIFGTNQGAPEMAWYFPPKKQAKNKNSPWKFWAPDVQLYFLGKILSFIVFFGIFFSILNKIYLFLSNGNISGKFVVKMEIVCSYFPIWQSEIQANFFGRRTSSCISLPFFILKMPPAHLFHGLKCFHHAVW
jgi:hypothetical protein